MITIEHLDVQFDVQGDSDEERFAELFSRYIERWSNMQLEEQKLQRMLKANRLLGDREPGPGGVA
jgi:hypothetical protein